MTSRLGKGKSLTFTMFVSLIKQLYLAIYPSYDAHLFRLCRPIYVYGAKILFAKHNKISFLYRVLHAENM